MIRKLRVKFICTNMIIVLTLISIMLGLVLSFTRDRIKEDSIQMMRSAASGPLLPFRPGDRSDDVRLPFFKLTLSSKGELLSCEGGSYDLSDEAFLMELVTSAKADGKENGVLGDYHLRYLIHEMPDEEIIVFSDITSETRAAGYLFKNCILIGLAGLVLFFIVSVLLARWAVKPVEQAWEQQKQFVADASHDLKTPLTVILTDTELLQSASCSEEDRKSFLNSIHTMGEQMRGLIEELLSLTRADDPDSAKALQLMDLSRCVSDAVLPFEPVFYEKGLVLETEIEEGLCIKGDETQMKQVTEILLDNAQKYCAPETETQISLKRQGRNAILMVESHGDEISKDDLERIFNRFYRIDRTRSMNQSYGLGLAIAKQTVENHKGKIWAESREGSNCFFVQLPAE